MALDPKKKRLVEDDEFVKVNVRIDPPQPGKTGAFSARKHRYYTPSGLEGGFGSCTPRIQYLIDKIAEIAEETGDVVPYAFVDRDGNRWSVDAGCLDAIGPSFQKLVTFEKRGGYIIGLIPGSKFPSRKSPQVSDLADDIADIANDVSLPPTERKALIAARIGQGKFRKRVLALWNGRCAVTGCSLVAVIRASHLLPWRAATNEERLDPENGLPLVATLDALFDAGLISFDPDGVLLANRAMASHSGLLEENMRLSRNPTARMQAFLAKHRAANGFPQ
ncbi:HNH endonuclease [Aquibium microcysteis]|uniref:HNH endonuclease n=1 Tax=Aquibium microcysteis TaxID=675281 RepID=UPI00165D015B|nr:HNH endonuclease signature motif containing protein [Aquibium microcysteis]